MGTRILQGGQIPRTIMEYCPSSLRAILDRGGFGASFFVCYATMLSLGLNFLLMSRSVGA